jgi:ubiquitin
MDTTEIAKIQEARAQMREARKELLAADQMLSTKEAVAACPLGGLRAETLTSYPDYVLPRVSLRPGAKRATYRWDPRDLLALPTVLRRWQRAVDEGREEEFKKERIAELAARDEVRSTAPREAA